MSEAKRRKIDCDENLRMYPVIPDELCEDIPLQEVYVDEIRNSKDISKVVVELNAKLPIPELTHLKRIKFPNVLLFPTNFCTKDDVSTYLQSKKFDITYLKNNIQIVKVAKIPPKVRKQFDVVNKLWPCNFHSNKYLEKLSTNTLFNSSEMQHHGTMMSIAICVAEYSKEKFRLGKIGVVVYDPKIESVVAIGYASKQDSPVGHAVMKAIDNVAITQNGGAWEQKRSDEEINQNGIPLEYLRFLQEKYPQQKFGASKYKNKADLDNPEDGPYLCTRYYVYTTHEPCIMCSMALIHSRVKRLFYGSKSSNGGVSSLCKIHTVKDLNHHYEVFGGLLENEL